MGGWVWVWRRFFRRQASAVRAFSLNEFDGFRQIGNESGGSPVRYLGDLKFLFARGEDDEGSGRACGRDSAENTFAHAHRRDVHRAFQLRRSSLMLLPLAAFATNSRST